MDLYTDKNLQDCQTALIERMHARPTKTRPLIDGWINKDGTFLLWMTGNVYGPIDIRTRYNGVIIEDTASNSTLIVVRLPWSGDASQTLVIIFASVLLAIIVATSGNFVGGFVVLLIGVALILVLRTNTANNDIFVKTIKQTLRARERTSR